MKNILDKLPKNKLYDILVSIAGLLMLIWGVEKEFIALVIFSYLFITYVRKSAAFGVTAKYLERKTIVSKVVLMVREMKSDMINKKLRTLLLFIVLILMMMWKVSPEGVFLWMLFLSFLFYDWENRIIAGLALLALASCPFLLVYKEEALAEAMAIYAYYFLVMTVILQIVELKSHPERFDEGEDEDGGEEINEKKTEPALPVSEKLLRRNLWVDGVVGNKAR